MPCIFILVYGLDLVFDLNFGLALDEMTKLKDKSLGDFYVGAKSGRR